MGGEERKGSELSCDREYQTLNSKSSVCNVKNEIKSLV